MAIDATVGGSAANSYADLTEANDYFTDRLHTTVWDVATDPEMALVTASRLLDWYMKWKGVKTDTTTPQAMDWPRTDVIDGDGVDVDTDIIPPAVKVAVFELALVNISADRTADNDLNGLSQVKVGPLMVKSDATSLRTSKSETIPDHINKILRGLIQGGTGGIQATRLVRA